MRSCLPALPALHLLLIGCGGNGGAITDGPTGDPPLVDAPMADAMPDTPPAVFSVSGTVVGPAAPVTGPIAVIWSVDGPGSDYLYKFGDGTSAGATHTAGLSGDPPVMARTRAAMTDVGIGILALLSPGTSIPEGVTSLPATVGLSARYAIIYRGATDTGPIVTWTTAFPVGLSCGRCVDSMMGFDRYEPVDCASLVIDTATNPNFCNFN